MNKRVLKTLEYNKIIDLLVEKAGSDSGKQKCRDLLPMTDLNDINQAQAQTKDALSRLFKKGSLSFGGLHNVNASMKRLEIGGVLSIPELLAVCSLLDVAKRAKAFSRSDREEKIEDSLDEFFDGLEPLTPLSEEIRRCILSEEEIADDASSTLKNIRRSIQNMNSKIRSQMNSMLNSSSVQTHLQDNIITMRNGRYCLPVKAESRSQIPGMIHDQSSTGSTIFVEPMAIVKLNNDLRELFVKEKEEIEVILANLSNLVGEYIPYIEDNYRILSELDFIFAKAALAKEYNGMPPLFNEEGRIHIRKGCHPLLNKHKVVPIDVYLGGEFDQLIITGPNTGGKTVSLKTVGLLTLMGQAGLHIPAGDRSELAIFHEVFADIGDEQSIEQSLSTFSSHLTNIISILDQADDRSLVLFDELCAGTDPTEGAALAISILSRLHNYGIRTMATTHYSEIKVYALTTDGVENACCEFSVETLSPTYRLLIGIPGKSNAFAISEKLGLSKDLIEDAKTRIDQENTSFEDLLTDLENSRVTIENDKLAIAKSREEIATLQKRLEEKQEKLDTRRERIIREANEEAFKILQEAKNTADETIRSFNKMQNGQTTIQDMEKERTKIRGKMSDVEKNMSKKKAAATPTHQVPKKLRIGDRVKVHSMNLTGTVHTLPNAKGDLYVQMGILRSLVNIKDLSLVEEKESSYASNKYQKTGGGKIKMSKASNISTEINLIGKRPDEAIAVLDKYLDDALLTHMPSVRIVHGKGTGALRKAVHSYLRGLPYIKSFRLGEFGEGDAGVTIAEFK